MFHVGDVVRKLRLEKKWTLDDLVRESGVSRGTLSLLEQGKSNWTRSVLEKVAAALGTTTEGLHATAAQRQRRRDANPEHFAEAEELDSVDVSGYRRDDIPVIQEGEASPNGMTWDADSRSLREIEDRTSRPYDYPERGAYAVVLRGDSMEPLLKRGMRLIVSTIQTISDGDLAYVQLKSGERLAKIATRQTDGWLLTSANPAYPPRAVRVDEIQHIHKVAYVRLLK